MAAVIWIRTGTCLERLACHAACTSACVGILQQPCARNNNTAIRQQYSIVTQAAKLENMPAGVYKCAVMFLVSQACPAACISSCVGSLQ
jgi:hypothetical protein